MSWPLTITRPEVGRSIAATIFISVDLPAPDGPPRKTSSPLAMFRETSCSASASAEYFLETDWNSIMGGGLSQQRFGELVGAEGLQVLQFFAHADEVDRHRTGACDRGQDAAFRRAVQLGDDQAGQLQSIVEGLDLGQCVLAGVAVDDQQDFVRRAIHALADHALD